MMKNSDLDDLDRLFARSEAPTPAVDVGGRARARLRAIRSARRLTLIALADAAALIALGALAFLLGGALAENGVLSLVQLATEDRRLALTARRELTLMLVAGVPWPYVLVAALDALLLFTLTTSLLRGTDALVAAHATRERR